MTFMPIASPGPAIAVAVHGPSQYRTSNQRGHWAVGGALTRAWRGASHTLHRQRRGELFQVDPRTSRRHMLERVHLDVVVVFPDERRRRDPHNVMPSIKAAIDGAVDARLLLDDDERHLLSVTVTGVVEPGSYPSLRMTWLEVA